MKKRFDQGKAAVEKEQQKLADGVDPVLTAVARLTAKADLSAEEENVAKLDEPAEAVQSGVLELESKIQALAAEEAMFGALDAQAKNIRPAVDARAKAIGNIEKLVGNWEEAAPELKTSVATASDRMKALQGKLQAAERLVDEKDITLEAQALLAAVQPAVFDVESMAEDCAAAMKVTYSCHVFWLFSRSCDEYRF